MQYPPSAPAPHTTTTIPQHLCAAAAHACSLPNTGAAGVDVLVVLVVILFVIGLGFLILARR